MFRLDIEKWVPRFILNDKNGYALARAIEAALQKMNDIIAEGVGCVMDFDTMPEWRLDELAWETNCLYDYGADIEKKRAWVRNAVPYYRLFGTPQAVYQYLAGYFGSIDLEENWQYGGEPYHFRVTVEGDWTAENEAWARRAIHEAKNVRSVLDSFRIGTRCYIGMTAECEERARFGYPMTGTEKRAGRWPEINTLGVLDEPRAAVNATAEPTRFQYPTPGAQKWVGRWPEINTQGVLDESAKVAAEGTAEPLRYPYPLAGTKPQTNTESVVVEAQAGIDAGVTQALFPYRMAGTRPGVNTDGVLDETAAALDSTAEPARFPYDMAGTAPELNTIGELDGTPIQSAQAEDIISTILYKMCGEDEI